MFKFYTSNVLDQCFSTGVSWNPRIPWTSYKGSANFDKYDKFVGFIDICRGEMY